MDRSTVIAHLVLQGFIPIRVNENWEALWSGHSQRYIHFLPGMRKGWRVADHQPWSPRGYIVREISWDEIRDTQLVALAQKCPDLEITWTSPPLSPT